MLTPSQPYRQEQVKRSYYFVAFLMCVFLLIPLFLLTQEWTSAAPTQSPEYEARKVHLLSKATHPFVDDPMRTVPPTPVDLHSFEDINKLACPKPLNNSNGWSIEMRTGGRPFLNFDSIKINGTTWTPTQCTPTTITITQQMLNVHYATGRGVNRMWLIHPTRNGSSYPIMLVMTPDGFFNTGGAQTPKLQGATTRIGFIGEPYDINLDYPQHVDEVDISVVDNTTLLIVYNIHSAAGEGVLEVELIWDSINDQPELHLRSAHAVRSSMPEAVNLGFAGFDFMKGPTLHGLMLENYSPVEKGIQAFHDGRNLFLVYPDGSFKRELLVAPVLTSTIVRQDIASDVITGSKIVLDQAQNGINYYSKVPTPPYGQRTDLILKLTASSTVSPIHLRRAQTSVNLADANPEANETVNVFYATDMSRGQLYEFSYILTLAAEDFDKLYSARRQGVVFVSDRSESRPRLYFQALDAYLVPVDQPIPLTDVVISDPHHPSSSADGQYIIFDADDYGTNANQRIYLLNLSSGDVRRLSVDLSPLSSDYGASLNADRTLFAMISTRHGTTTRLVVVGVEHGIWGGFGGEVDYAEGADWCHSANRIAYSNFNTLYIRDFDTSISTPIVSSFGGIGKPRFSPDCNEITYVNPLISLGVWAVRSDGTNNRQLLTDGDNPVWIDSDHLVFQRTVNGNTNIYLLTPSTGITSTLITSPGMDSEPVFVKAVGPTVKIKSPSVLQTCTNTISGFVGSVGVPVVKLNGMPAQIQGDEWSISLNLGWGIQTLTAMVTDGATGLTSQDQVTFCKCCVYLPWISKGP